MRKSSLRTKKINKCNIINGERELKRILIIGDVL